MSLSTITETNWNGLQLPAVSSPGADQTERIMAALGLTTDGLPKVDEETLARYYTYLSANSVVAIHGPLPAADDPAGEREFRCTVLELLDPTKTPGRRV